MAADGPGGRDELKATQRASGAGRTLAAVMPRLILEARKIAATVIHGLHGRRRAGRDDNLEVREREWEAAHTIWIWADRSPSMNFVSRLSRDSKLDRGLT